MSRTTLILFCVTTLLLSACNSTQSLTKQEYAVQSAADEQVAQILFARELDGTASYNVRKDGYVVIKFRDDVTQQAYTAAVTEMRQNPAISGVKAKQGGREVCILKHGR